ncbi:MAG: hypothetical protein ABMA25_14070 [Ilumatobacteraceae bacterium]
MARSISPPKTIRLLLDQGFPKPPGFDPKSVYPSLDWVHLYDWRRDLSETSTPDWVLYCEAAADGFTAIVTRDFTQAEQAEEMVALSHLRDFHVIAWRERMDDPIAEWGQLLAYLPKLSKYIAQQDSKVILLPVPTLSTKNIENPKTHIATIADGRGQSIRQVRHEALASMADWEELHHLPGRYTATLRQRR